jgi:L-rhamnose mutarotase
VLWPEMLRALRATEWHDYSLFLRDDGLLVGYPRPDLGMRVLDEVFNLDDQLESVT